MKKLVAILILMLFYQTRNGQRRNIKWSLDNWTVEDQYDYITDPEWKAYDVMNREDTDWNLC